MVDIISKNMLTLNLEKVSCKIFLGIHEWEKLSRRDCLISIFLEIDDGKISNFQDVSLLIDYSLLFQSLQSFVSSAHFSTIEYLIFEIEKNVILKLQNFKMLKSCKISIQKCNILPLSTEISLTKQFNYGESC